LLLLSVFIRSLKDACSLGAISPFATSFCVYQICSLFLLFSNCSYFDIDLIAETCQPSESVPDQAISSLCMLGLLNAWVAVQFVPFVIDYRIVLLLHSTNIGMMTRKNANYVSFLIMANNLPVWKLLRWMIFFLGP